MPTTRTPVKHWLYWLCKCAVRTTTASFRNALTPDYVLERLASSNQAWFAVL